jgi:hypothetical protein
MRSRVVALVAAALLVVGTAGCGDDDDGGGPAVRPAVEQIAPAIAALEAKLGGPQQYFEINATPQVVNLFVADAAKASVTPYVYVSGAVAESGPPSSAEGNTFAATAATFDPATILAGVTDELPDPDIVVFTIVGGPSGAVHYAASVQSDEGGTLDVSLAADGSVQAVDPGS